MRTRLMQLRRSDEWPLVAYFALGAVWMVAGLTAAILFQSTESMTWMKVIIGLIASGMIVFPIAALAVADVGSR